MNITKNTTYHVFIDEERKFTLTSQELADLQDKLTEVYNENHEDITRAINNYENKWN